MSDTVVFLDFDGTLTRRDSLLPFLRRSCGDLALLRGLVLCSPVLLGFVAGRIPNDVAKQHLLAQLLRGRDIAALRAVGEQYAAQALDGLLRPEGMAKLAAHRAAGDRCVLVSASLDLWLEPWARRHGIEAVLCSQLETDAQGRVSGRLAGANCHGQEKVRRVRAFLGGSRPARIVAYGDSRADLPLLQFADEGWRWRAGTFVACPPGGRA